MTLSTTNAVSGAIRWFTVRSNVATIGVTGE